VPVGIDALGMNSPITFKPLAMERVWGGRRFETLEGKVLPPDVPVGELWEVVDREEAQSVVDCGLFEGQTLQSLWSNHRGEIFGADYLSMDAKRFPLLVKLLDAADKLSVQVHPPASKAVALGGEPKTEVWYFLESQPGAVVYAGLKNGVMRDEFEKRLDGGGVEETLHSIPVHTGESIFIPSGRLHAIGGGNLIAEIQQNSDTTYRVYDWGRTGLDGIPRTLHVRESMESIDFEDFEPCVSSAAAPVVADCPLFVSKNARCHRVWMSGRRGVLLYVSPLKDRSCVVGVSSNVGDFSLFRRMVMVLRSRPSRERPQFWSAHCQVRGRLVFFLGWRWGANLISALQ
jgi:mannose-6-phosphate isomerase